MRYLVMTAMAVLLTISFGAFGRELKIGYVDSERIIEENSDFQEARKKLQDEEQGYSTQATALENVVKQMREELQAQSLMLSAEARADRETRLSAKVQELDAFRKQTWGESGTLFNRNLELSRPILEKINAAIEKLSLQDGYDMVFDAASGNIVYALPQYDITQLVLDELKKE